MKGLNKIFYDFDRLRNKYLKLFPMGNKSLNNIFNSVLQVFENLNYENKRGNTKRYTCMRGDVPVDSVLVVLNSELAHINKIDFEKMDDFLSVLDAKLEQVSWDIISARRSINQVLRKLDKVREPGKN